MGEAPRRTGPDDERDRHALAVIPPGKFTMGSPENEPEHRGDEAQVAVTLTKPMRLGIHEVAQGEWTAVMGSQSWKGKRVLQEGKNFPANWVKWGDATEFCRKLAERERAAGKLSEGCEYRLPTEAEWEWEWDCRAGMSQKRSYEHGPSTNRSNRLKRLRHLIPADHRQSES